MTCFTTIVAIVLGVFLLASLIRWFDEATEAVNNGWWNRVSLLLLFPFSCWFYPTKVAAGRPTPVPHHEPVRGFGSLPKTKPTPAPSSQEQPRAATPASTADDQPPPGTPKEFLEKPKIPPKKPKVELDPEKIAKLKEKMRKQGMLPPDGD